MNVMDILRPYVDRPTDTQQDFDEVARQVPADTLGEGLADAFRQPDEKLKKRKGSQLSSGSLSAHFRGSPN